VKQPKPAAKTCNECFGLLRNMGWPAVNDEENLVLGADHQPSEKLDENLGVDAAFFLDHEPHVAARSNRRDEAHPVPRSSPEHNRDRKSTRLNSSHRTISYAVFCLKKKNTK